MVLRFLVLVFRDNNKRFFESELLIQLLQQNGTEFIPCHFSVKYIVFKMLDLSGKRLYCSLSGWLISAKPCQQLSKLHSSSCKALSTVVETPLQQVQSPLNSCRDHFAASVKSCQQLPRPLCNRCKALSAVVETPLQLLKLVFSYFGAINSFALVGKYVEKSCFYRSFRALWIVLMHPFLSMLGAVCF